MSNIIYHDFKNKIFKKDQSNSKTFTKQHISNWTGKSGTKYISIKFDAILDLKNNKEKRCISGNLKNSVELLQEIIGKINDK